MLELELLERRELPAAALAGTTLAVTGTDGDDVIDVRVLSLNTGGQVVLATVNGVAQSFDAAQVQSLFISGGKGADDLNNMTALPATILGGKGDDVIQGGSGNDLIDEGDGKGIVYDLLGTNVVDGGDGKDALFVNAQSLTLSDRQDQVVTFFAANRQVGSGAVLVEDGVLYVMPPAGGTSALLTRQGTNLVLWTSWAGAFAFAARDVDYLAYFGGPGDDVLVNQTRVSQVSYGAGGNDFQSSGTGDVAFMKGSSGRDVLVNNARRGFLTSNSGPDVLVNNGGPTIFYSYNPADLVAAGRKDRVRY